MKTDRFQGNISNKLLDNFNLNEGLSTVGSTLATIFKKPDNITNTTVIQSPQESEEDNTMLYVGIGGGALLLVVLLIVFLK